MSDFIVALARNGRIEFQVLHDPGPEWQRKFFPGRTVAQVELSPGDGFTLDDLRRLSEQMAHASLTEIVTRLRLDREYLAAPAG